MTSPTEPAFGRPRVAAGILFLDEDDRVLLVVLSYKTFLDLPGGNCRAPTCQVMSRRRQPRGGLSSPISTLPAGGAFADA
jgi:8-oxo-dGTP diphosphatase